MMQHPTFEISSRSAWAYGLMGLPLAFVALPLYVHAPHHYAQTMGVPLASLGLALLLARAIDAVTDPWLGRLIDGWFAQSPQRVLQRMAWGVVALLLGVVGLWFAPPSLGQWATGWLVASITLTSLGYSQLTIAHQAWGAHISHTPVQRSQTMAWREGWALLGVVSASVLPSLVGWGTWTAVFVLMLAVGLWGWRHSASSTSALKSTLTPSATGAVAAVQPWRNPAFVGLLAVFVVNGMASALPATLVLFFIEDVLQLARWSGAFLGLYFASAAAVLQALPSWARVTAWGLR